MCIRDRSVDLEIESVKYFKQFVILKFKGLDDIEQVEKYRKASLYVTCLLYTSRCV